MSCNDVNSPREQGLMFLLFQNFLECVNHFNHLWVHFKSFENDFVTCEN